MQHTDLSEASYPTAAGLEVTHHDTAAAELIVLARACVLVATDDEDGSGYTRVPTRLMGALAAALAALDGGK